MIPFRISIWLGLAVLWCTPALSAGFAFHENDHVAFIGNGLPDRMQHDGWLETYLQSANPDKRLVIRNLGFTGDQVAFRPRNDGFPSADEYLTRVGADVIFAFFGYNESYEHNPTKFRDELTTFINETRQKRYNGASAPRIVLFSPIAFQNLHSRNFPDGEEQNRWLAIYTDAMASVARRKQVAFVDLFYPTQDLYDASEEPLTINGVHLNAAGNKAVAALIVKELMGDVNVEHEDLIRTAVLEKNWCWFNRYRATDGNDIWGTRSVLKFVDEQTNAEVLQHELVMLDIMSGNRDEVIWQAARGVTVEPDDSNVPNPVLVKTNLEASPEEQSEYGGHKFVRPEDGVATLTLQKGLKANLFASEEMFPEFVNPVQLDVDTRGRVWAAVWATYPKWQPDWEMRDRLLILPDEDRDGVADEAITFARVHNPTGFAFWNGGVVVASAPNIWFLKDTDGDDKADVRQVLMSSLDSADTHHTANSFDYGPDGYIYYQRGIFNVSNVETPWQSSQVSGQPGMYRFNPRTHRFAYHAYNSPNPHGADFDYWGYHYSTDATSGEAFQIRPTNDGKFKMYKLLEKTVRPVASSGIISSAQLPPEMNGNYIILNTIGFLGIKQYTLKNSDGAMWGTETDDLLVSSDPNFRPTDFVVGSDGALYVSDWSNPVIGHMQHNIRDPSRDHEHGRIYRVTAKGRPLQKPVKIDGASIEALLDALKHPVDSVRLRARIELSERDTDDVIAAARKWTDQFDPSSEKDAHHLLEALWLFEQHNVVNEELLALLLNSPEPNARRAAERVKSMWELEGKFDTDGFARAPEEGSTESARAALEQAKDYLKQEASPPPRMVGDTLEIHIQTLIEQMKYDRAEFTVAAGMKVRLIFTNPDAMDHNMVMVQPGAASRIAVAAMKLEEEGLGVERHWIPESDEIIFALNLLTRGESQTIEFTAPSEPGDYTYLCTFPGHWPLMRGTMVVVDHFDKSILAANRTPAVAQAKSTRAFVADWKFDALKAEIDDAMSGRSFEAGKEMFRVATCVQCHSFEHPEDAIGADLNGLAERYSAAETLQQILEPSSNVDDKYKTHVVEAKGREYYGMIIAEDANTLTLLDNPLDPETAVTVKKSDIETTDVIDISPMPTDLLATLHKDEIWDLVAYVRSGGNPSDPVFKASE